MFLLFFLFFCKTSKQKQRMLTSFCVGQIEDENFFLLPKCSICFSFDLLQILGSPICPYVNSLFRFRFADVGQLRIGQMLKAVQRRRALAGHAVGEDVPRGVVGLMRLRFGFRDRFTFPPETSEIWKTSEWWNVLVATAAELKVFSKSGLTVYWNSVYSWRRNLKTRFKNR